MPRDMMNTAEVIEYLGISRSHLYELVRECRIPFARPGQRKLIFPKRLVDEWIEWNARSNFEPANDKGLSRGKKSIRSLSEANSRLIDGRKR